MRHPDEVLELDPDSLTMGRPIRFNHMECSSHKHDKTLSVTRVHDGLMYHCYRCGMRGKKRTTMSPYDAQCYLDDRVKTRNGDIERRIELPSDFWPMCLKPNRIPAKAYAWLYKYELEDSDLCTYNIGFSERIQRVVLPIYHDTELIGWVGRDINYKNGSTYQKYHNEFKEGGRVYFIAGSYNDFMDTSGNIKPVVFVEDILSAIKCRKATGYVVVALLNTSVGDSTVRHLMEDHVNYLWLDDDARIKALRQVFKYKQQGIDITSIYTHVDPKDVPLTRIPSYVK